MQYLGRLYALAYFKLESAHQSQRGIHFAMRPRFRAMHQTDTSIWHWCPLVSSDGEKRSKCDFTRLSLVWLALHVQVDVNGGSQCLSMVRREVDAPCSISLMILLLDSPSAPGSFGRVRQSGEVTSKNQRFVSRVTELEG
jgi:hypothetical protein